MNSNIALGVQPLQIPDQGAAYHRALTMAALLGQHDLQGLQIQEGQRTLAQNQASDAAARDSSSMEDYLRRLARINPGAAIKLKSSMLDTQKTQGEVSKQQSDQAAGLASSVTSAAPQDQPAIYKNMVAEWTRLGLPSAAPLPPDFSPEFLPHLNAIATRGLSADKAMERGDYRAAAPEQVAGNSGTPTTMGKFVAPQEQIEQTTIGQGSTTTTLPTATLPATEAPPLDSSEISASDYRNEAARLRAKGTKVASDQAKEYMAEADRIEGRSLEKQKMEQDRFSPVAGAPGVSFNKKTGVYDLNGKTISADEVQKIANQQARSGASVVTQNSGPRAFYGDYGKNMADQLSAEQKSAQKAADTVTTINKMRGELDSGMYTGGFAERKLGVINMLNGLGIQVDEKKLANTQAFKSFVGSQLLQHAKDLGTNPSNADAVRIDKIIGNIENDPNALQKIMDFNEEMGRRAVDRFNKHYQEVKKDPNAQFGFDMTVQQPEKYKSRDIQVRSNTQAAPTKGAAPLPLTNSKGWTLHLDAQGRQAYVSPDGSQYEEAR